MDNDYPIITNPDILSPRDSSSTLRKTSLFSVLGSPRRICSPKHGIKHTPAVAAAQPAVKATSPSMWLVSDSICIDNNNNNNNNNNSGGNQENERPIRLASPEQTGSASLTPRQEQFLRTRRTLLRRTPAVSSALAAPPLSIATSVASTANSGASLTGGRHGTNLSHEDGDSERPARDSIQIYRSVKQTVVSSRLSTLLGSRAEPTNLDHELVADPVSLAASGHHDVPGTSDTRRESLYEFSAPKFHDFAAPEHEEEADADKWFDVRDVSPPSLKRHKASPLHRMVPTPRKLKLLADGSNKLQAQRSTSTSKRTSSAKSSASAVSTKSAISQKPAAKTTSRVSSAPTLSRIRARKQALNSTSDSASNTTTQILKKKVAKSTVGVTKTTKRSTNDLTIPKPFNLHSSHKTRSAAAAAEPPHSPFVPLALKVQQFVNKTPDRFRTRVTKRPTKQQSIAGRLTHPKSPFMLTKMRAKPMAHIPTREEREEEEMRNMQHFKANPVNQTILKSNKPLGVPVLEPLPLTVPMSPAITKPKPRTERSPSPPKIIKANPIPDFDHPFQPKIEHRKVEPLDFSLPGDEISQRRRQELEQLLLRKEEELKALQKFKAQPIMTDKQHSLPAIPPVPLTHPVGFELQTDLRGALYKMSLEQKLAREKQEAARLREFHANPMPDGEPFLPKRSDRPLTHPDDITLHTDVRSKERDAFDEQRAQREAQEARMREEKEKKLEEQLEAQLRQLRKELIHQAQPVRRFVPVHIRPSDKKLTDPHSPAIGPKRKLKFMTTMH
eukprot:jgi/Hompol1/4474/HPOL_001733-RA